MIPLLADVLICPACLPEENELVCQVSLESQDDIVSGTLDCRSCGVQYPISEGVAFLLPPSHDGEETVPSRYETPSLLSSYLWSHYADLCQDPDAHPAYQEWANLMEARPGPFLDAGCAVGRFTFDMSRKYDFAVGIDNSATFVRTARALRMNRGLKVEIAEEGRLTRPFHINLPGDMQPDKIDFIVADVTAIPFPADLFSGLATLNIVDKVPDPLLHLKEMDRVALGSGARLIFSDPFSWTEEAADKALWLGGTGEGPHAGRGAPNVAALLEGRDGHLSPAWEIERQGSVWWKIRNHANHFELIRSCFIKARR
ncbi:MAG: methyltransferase domain-containing protein [Deltaproteobacteria bacterium]|nr:methyltransferase domain-containing protein [Deltaproteobacteria bacterium]MBW1818708.1 methyltransferase domain-containing protein [Deltaproteobacteria bacterium]MBW2284889.1 methyltransferase domain-containing protein [Deltaproteobacteria bacterium]